MGLIDPGLWFSGADAAAFAGRPALFLDRDGVIVEDSGYVGDPNGVRLIPGAAETIAEANRLAVPVVVVTNQSGVARGLFGWDSFEAVQDVIRTRLAEAGARLDAVLACGYHEKGTGAMAVADHPWRKPNPGMLTKAAEAMQIDLARSLIVGDRVADLEAGQRAGLRAGILVETGKSGEEQGDPKSLPADFTWRRVDSLGAARGAVVRYLTRPQPQPKE